MRKLSALVKRNLIEIVRDPLTAVFCVAFPIVMLVFMQVIFLQTGFVPDNFKIENYAVGICVFGYTFLSMFTAMSIAGDKNSSFIKRIEVSPVNRGTYLFSFVLSGLPIAFCQTVLFFTIAFLFKLPFNGKSFLAMAYLLPSALFYISLGVLLGVVCKNEKQTGPINSIVVSLAGMLGGIFMPLSAFSGGFLTFVNILPFSHSVTVASEIYTLGAKCIYPHGLIMLGYILLVWIVLFLLEKVKRR